MKKLRLTMIVFAILISLPISVVAWRAHGSLDREARSQVRFFSDRLFDEMEAWLADLVRREESRAVDEYQYRMVTSDGRSIVSPLAGVPGDNYIIGYFQNNPDGSFQTPLMEGRKSVSSVLVQRVATLETLNTGFNRRKIGPHTATPMAPVKSFPTISQKTDKPSFAGRFLKDDPYKKSKVKLGREKARVEEITASQAINLASKGRASRQWSTHKQQISEEQMRAEQTREERIDVESRAVGTVSTEDAWDASSSISAVTRRDNRHLQPQVSPDRFQVEVAPLQAMTLDEGLIFVFRRIVIDGQIYRQGVVIGLGDFLDHLLTTFYDNQPIARYTQLLLTAPGFTVPRDQAQRAVESPAGAWLAERTFPAPFDFLTARMQLVSLPPSPAGRVLTLALVVLGIVMVAGLFVIYQNARAVLDLSERRSRFVSTVTHELKTPLTNIRMYIEMLEQGIAPTPEREQEYLGVLSSESTRLSGLIENVLELSRLERQTRRFMYSEGDLSDVLVEVQASMAERLAREGFELSTAKADIPVFAYDREVLVQVLINLMENSIKFGRHLSCKRIDIGVNTMEDWVCLRVSDSGPGIPKSSLSKVFDDFYRVDNSLAKSVGGTGIGLALVKKLILAMGGRVRAENNQTAGCTIIIDLPTGQQTEKKK